MSPPCLTPPSSFRPLPTYLKSQLPASQTPAGAAGDREEGHALSEYRILMGLAARALAPDSPGSFPV